MEQEELLQLDRDCQHRATLWASLASLWGVLHRSQWTAKGKQSEWFFPPKFQVKATLKNIYRIFLARICGSVTMSIKFSSLGSVNYIYKIPELGPVLGISSLGLNSKCFQNKGGAEHLPLVPVVPPLLAQPEALLGSILPKSV